MTTLLKVVLELKVVLGRPVRTNLNDTSVALIDVIMAICFVDDQNRLKISAQKNASDYLQLISSRYRHLFDDINVMRFKGQGQRPTPVVPI